MSIPRNNVLFVCVGNACRSPIAEGLFNFESHRLGLALSTARSAGVRPYTHVIRDSVKVMRELGIDISDHKPTLISQDMMEWANKIVLLDPYILGELDSQNNKKECLLWDIEDPYNTSLENFRRVRDLLHQKILGLIDSQF